MPFDFTVTVTVERPGPLDKFGDRSAPSTHTIPGCSFYPSGGGEEMTARDTVIDLWTLLTPSGADIQAKDVVVLPGGLRYEVDGNPGSFDNGPWSPWKPGIKAHLRAVKG